MTSDHALPSIDLHVRASVLIWASAMTINRADPATVLSHAEPLLEWLAEASTDEDLNVRHPALRRQHLNTQLMPGYEPDDDPQRFLAAAERSYAFLQPSAPARLAEDVISGGHR